MATLLVDPFCAWVQYAVVVTFELLWLVSADAARSLNVVNRTSPLGLFPQMTHIVTKLATTNRKWQKCFSAAQPISLDTCPKGLFWSIWPL